MDSVCVVTTSAGPDSGVSFQVATPVAVGSSKGSIGAVDDDALSARHFVVDEVGGVTPLQCVATSQNEHGERRIDAGNTQFFISAEPECSQSPDSEYRNGSVIRPRRHIEVAPIVEVAFPPDPPQRPRGTTLIMPLASLGTSVLMAVVLNSFIYLAFGAVAVVMGGVSACAELICYRRERRHHRNICQQTDLAERAQHEALLQFRTRQLRSRWPISHERFLMSKNLWESRPCHEDFLSCVVGIHTTGSSETGIGEPVFVRLAEHQVVVIEAPREVGESIVRQLCTQICLRTGFADVAFETNSICEVPETYRSNSRTTAQHLVVITDEIDDLSSATSNLRQQLLNEERVTVIALARPGEHIPACCEVLIRVEGDWRGRLTTDDESAELHAAGVSQRRWKRLVHLLSTLRDPECIDASGNDLPAAVSLPEMVRRVDRSLRVEIGKSHSGACEIDLVRDGPHALIAGTTGSGKSEFLRTLVTLLCATYSSTALNLVLVDFKGGSTFDELARLPHVADVASDLDGELVDRMLGGLHVEIARRKKYLRDHHVRDFSDLPEQGGLFPRLVLVIDEFAALAKRHPEQMAALVAIASQGRSLGVHLILATQRLTGAVTDDIQANSDLRISFRVASVSESRDVIGSAQAAEISKSSPGRAFVLVPGHDAVEVQTGLLTADAVNDALQRSNALCDPPARRPWSQPLSDTLPPRGDDIGVVDVREHQRHESWRWTPLDGRLSIEGHVGSRTTTALMSVLHHNPTTPTYVIDARGDSTLGRLADFPHVASVVHAWDEERRTRLVRMLNAEVHRRRSSEHRPPLLVAIDGITEFVRQLGDEELVTVRSLFREAESVGICLVTAGEEPPTPAPTTLCLGATSHRYQSMGLVRAGRGVLHRQGDHPREIQIRPSLHAPSSGAMSPSTVEILPEQVVWTSGSGRRQGASTFVDVGVSYDDLTTASCEVRDGRHLLVIGPSGSGRTTALHTVARSWSRVRSGVVTLVRNGCFDTIPVVDGPHLVVVDDADRTSAPDEFFRRLNGSGDLTVVAAVDPLSLRLSFDHWTQQLRRSQTSILMSECAHTDAELAHTGRLAPLPIAARPGLAWVISGGATTLVQIAAMLGECQLSQIPSISSDLTTPLWSSPEHQLA